MNQEIIRAKAIIPELRLNAEKAHQLTHNVANLLTVQRLLREHIHCTHTTLRAQSSASRKTNNIVSLGNITEEKEPPEPPPDEDESKPPVEEPPTEEPPVKEPSPNRSVHEITVGSAKTISITVTHEGCGAAGEFCTDL